MGLSSRAGHRVSALSNGMQKRAAIARAILHQPDVLLLDEPEAGLDSDSRRMLGELLVEWTSAGRSVAFTTHDIELGLAWGDRAAVLSQGRLTFPSKSSIGIQQALLQSTPSVERSHPCIRHEAGSNPSPKGEGNIPDEAAL